MSIYCMSEPLSFGACSSRVTHEEEAITHVSWAVVMLSSLLMAGDMMRMLPWRKLGRAMLIVAVNTKRISCASERKAAGRALGSEAANSVAGKWSIVSRWKCWSDESLAGFSTLDGAVFSEEAVGAITSTGWVGLSIVISYNQW